jgi:serine/threonine protein kinase
MIPARCCSLRRKDRYTCKPESIRNVSVSQMKDETSMFGAKPERLDRLVFEALQDSRPQEAAPTASLGAVFERPGGRIGRYKLLSILGEGGMGIVYLAEQEQPIRRRVALKVIKPGMDSNRVIARFEAERQALALLDHPNIAHVYDAGTTEAGRPYFVMEYVKGLPITEYCDHHKLAIEDRLNLFRQVCLAVHHAHQKGIIHRDMKPSNILVSLQDDQAIPKIIDFGVAKAIAQPLTERTLLTEDSQLLGTPEYMSPEQADMATEDIDTRSDIYSLGVLLYVLLTGVLPFDSDTLRTGGIEHIRQIIRETDPKTPSTRLTKLGDEARKIAENRRTEIRTLAKHLHKELEWIPLKAMRKERAERYQSASELADDIGNYLNGKPLIAGPLSNVYRLKKFVRRNKALVSGVTAILTVLVAGIVVSTLLAIGQARARSEAQAIADFLKNDVLSSVSPNKAKGSEITVRYILDAASENLEGKFKKEPLVEASIRDTLGWTYRMLGESKAAEPHLERTLQLRQDHLGASNVETLESMGRLAWLRCEQGRNMEAAELLEKGLSISRRLWGDGNAQALDFANTLGCAYKDLGRCDEAEQLYIRSIPVAQNVLGRKDNLSIFLVGNLGQVYEDQGRYDEAEQQYRETLRLSKGFWDDENIWTLVYKSFLARVYMRQEQYNKAENLYREILPIQRRVDGNQQLRTMWSVIGLAQVYTHLGKYNEAEKLFIEAREVLQNVRGSEHLYTLRRCMNGLAELYEEQKLYDKAEPLLKEALEIGSRTLGDNHAYTLETKNDLGVLYKEQNHYEDAEKYLLEAVEGRRLKLGDKHPHTQQSLNNLIALYEAWGKPEKAAEWRDRMVGEQVDE